MYKRCLIILTTVIIILNVIAWCFPGFCDWYTLYVTPIWVNTYGRFSDIFKFSLGERMIILGLFILLVAFINGIVYIFLHKKPRYKRFSICFYKSFLAIILVVCLVMTLNCSILYHCTPIDANKNKEKREYTIEELQILRNYIVEQCNYYVLEVKRDNNGYLVYDGNMQNKAKEALNNISDEYPKLKGYYPDIKEISFSKLMSQAYICGYYFPFSMEANCNSMMYITNYPAVYCHELAHLHGYIYEDEANYLAYLACISSDDVFFKYCGYLSVLYYVDNAYLESINYDNDLYFQQTAIDINVWIDDMFLLPEAWDAVEETAVLSTEVIDDISDNFTDASLQLNGVEDGIASYGRVVDLMLQYYDGVLY